MREVGAGKVAAALVLGLAASVASAQERDGGGGGQPAAAGWWAGLFGGKKAEPGRADPAPADTSPASAEQEALRREREENALWRRLKVCDRLNEIAVQTNDEALQRKVAELQDRVFQVYQQRTGGRLPGAPGGVDEALLGRRLGTGTALPTGERPAEDAGRAASLREGKR